jgi:DNA repair protein RecO (recombination protein O)
MFIHHRSQGLVIKKEDRGEADQLFTIYTKDFGKIDILAKSIRKISSKLRAGAEIFYLSEFEFIQGKGYKTLTDAIVLEKYNNLRQDLNRLKIAHQAAEILDDFIKGQEPDERIWNLFLKVFKKINDPKISGENLPEIYYDFLFNFISLLGYGVSRADFKKLKSFSRDYLSRVLRVNQ